MPKNTFHKLSELKKQQLLKAAYQEFALKSLDSASITLLVKKLGIAKGSIYQYFENKEDMYLYLLEYAEHRKIDIYKRSFKSVYVDLEQAFVGLNLIGLKFDLNFPDYSLFLLGAYHEQHVIKGKSISLQQISKGIELYKSLLLQHKLPVHGYIPVLFFQISHGLFNQVISAFNLDVVSAIKSQMPVQGISDTQLIEFVTDISSCLFNEIT